ncbi:hypothetical protein PIB30_022747 [Stylosanthes scabra]|uniref:Uncharacterized protein n=1 Tax=Stylosanthes scabra TaxID=79078 RepID=A0ABU6QAP2_9FABA|nr:hypothetical protein [Stylosanthes scabra]
MANELIRSVIRPTRPGPVANQRTISLKAHPGGKQGWDISLPQHLSGVELISKEDNRAKRHHTPPPISQGLRGNISRSTRRKTGLRGLMPPSQLSLGDRSSPNATNSFFLLIRITLAAAPVKTATVQRNENGS